MLAQYEADEAIFVAYGTDGEASFAVSGVWETDLAPFLTLVRGDGAEIIRMPKYYQWDDQVETVPSSASSPAEFLPQNIIFTPPRPTGVYIASPSTSDIEACFNQVFGLSAAA
jgi:hypothetical protein